MALLDWWPRSLGYNRDIGNYVDDSAWLAAAAVAAAVAAAAAEALGSPTRPSRRPWQLRDEL